jgi:hypothetical protein
VKDFFNKKGNDHFLSLSLIPNEGLTGVVTGNWSPKLTEKAAFPNEN